jgi:hypothetical protein
MTKIIQIAIATESPQAGVTNHVIYALDDAGKMWVLRPNAAPPGWKPIDPPTFTLGSSSAGGPSRLG